MVGVMLQAIPSFHAVFSEKGFFVPANTYETQVVNTKHCTALHYDRNCFSSQLEISQRRNSRHWRVATELERILFHLSTRELSFYTIHVMIHWKLDAKNRQLFDNRQRAVHSNQQNEQVNRRPSID